MEKKERERNASWRDVGGIERSFAEREGGKREKKRTGEMENLTIARGVVDRKDPDSEKCGRGADGRRQRDKERPRIGEWEDAGNSRWNKGIDASERERDGTKAKE